MKSLSPSLEKTVAKLLKSPPSEQRLALLEPLYQYLAQKLALKQEVQLHFICTHNSRRSQFAQVWAHVLAHYFELPLKAFSGGVEVTAFNPRAINSLQRQGFSINSSIGDNPHYAISYGANGESLSCFSKKFDHPQNPQSGFAAVMTCSDADDNCPFIPGAEQRIPLLYEDPKAFDDSPLETEKYAERSSQIGSELAYIFSKLKANGY